MRILVTGGAGFIGSNLVNSLVENNEVVVLDNLSNSKNNVNKKAAFIKGDITDMDDVIKAVKGCDVVFHLAASIDVRNSDEKKDYEVNFLGSKNVFEAANDIKAKIIFTSSAAVYGNAHCPVTEETECNPISQYGRSKLRAEKLLKDAFVLRLFNVYGYNSHGVIEKFCKSITNYETVIVNGRGNQTRDFVYVSDVVNALILGIENTGTYNIGTGKETSVLEIIDIIHKTTKCKPDVKFGMPIENEILRSYADNKKIKSLGWTPKVNLQEGIENVLELNGFKALPI